MKLLRVVILATALLVATLLPLSWFTPRPALADFTVTTPAITSSVVGPTSTLVYPTFSHAFTASGFSAALDVEILFNGVRIARGTTNGSGVLVASGTVPVVVSSTYTVTARSVANTNVLGSMTVSLRPTVTVIPISGGPGSPIAIRALGFKAGEVLTPTFEDDAEDCAGDNSLGTPAAASTSGTGAFNSTVPNVAAGTWYVSVNGSNSGCITAP